MNTEATTLTVERVTDAKPDSIMLGGDPTNPSWQEYLDQFVPDFQPHLLVLKKYIGDNGLMGMTGEAMQDVGEGEYRFSDGKEVSFTWRAWGDFMQAVMDRREGYMTYYM